MKIKTRDLTDLALRWAAAKALNADIRFGADTTGLFINQGDGFEYFTPDTDGEQAEPLIAGVDCVRGNDLYFPEGNEHGDFYEPLWLASLNGGVKFHGRTRLEASLRCRISKILGDEVDVPEELLKDFERQAPARERARGW